MDYISIAEAAKKWGDHLSAGSGFVRSRQNPGLDEVRKIMGHPKGCRETHRCA